VVANQICLRHHAIKNQANNLKLVQINYELHANHLSITLVISVAGKHCFGKCYSIPLVMSQACRVNKLYYMTSRSRMKKQKLEQKALKIFPEIL